MTTENKAAMALASRIVAGAVANACPLDEVRDLVEHQVRNRIRVDDEGNLSVVDDSGVPRVSMRPGCPPMTLEEYMDEIKSSRPTLFRSPGNSSASASSPATATSPNLEMPMAGNPFKQGPFFSITKQMILMKNDPAKAQQLQGEANQ